MEIVLFTKDGCQYCDMMQSAIMKEESIPDGTTFSIVQIDDENIKTYRQEFVEASGSQTIGFPITRITSVAGGVRYQDYIIGYSVKQLRDTMQRRKMMLSELWHNK